LKRLPLRSKRVAFSKQKGDQENEKSSRFQISQIPPKSSTRNRQHDRGSDDALCGAITASATGKKSSMAEQFMNEERARSLNAFHQLLDAIEHRRIPRLCIIGVKLSRVGDCPAEFNSISKRSPAQDLEMAFP
jgi:hypothetical protein